MRGSGRCVFLVLLALSSAQMFLGCSAKVLFSEDFDNGQFDQPPSPTPDKGKEIKLDQSGLAKIVTFPPTFTSKCMGYMQPKGQFPLSVYFNATTATSSMEGFQAQWDGLYVDQLDGGVAVGLGSGHFNMAFTLIFKDGKIKIQTPGNTEKQIGTFSGSAQEKKHLVLASVNKATKKCHIYVGMGDGGHFETDEPVQNQDFFDSNELYLRIWSVTNRPDNASNQDMYVIDYAEIRETKKK